MVPGLLRVLDAALPLSPGKADELEHGGRSSRPIPGPCGLNSLIRLRNPGAGGVLGPFRGVANKLSEHAAHSATILALLRDLRARVLEAEEIQAGIELAEHYAAEALRLFGSSRVNAELFLLEWLHRRATPSRTFTSGAQMP